MLRLLQEFFPHAAENDRSWPRETSPGDWDLLRLRTRHGTAVAGGSPEWKGTILSRPTSDQPPAMRLPAIATLLILWIVWAFVDSTIGMSDMVNADLVYFPDQAEYIKLATKCPDKTILWPPTRRCYKEGEQGPCNIGRILLFDKRLLKPYCKDTVV